VRHGKQRIVAKLTKRAYQYERQYLNCLAVLPFEWKVFVFVASHHSAAYRRTAINPQRKESPMSLIQTSPWDRNISSWLQERPFWWPAALDDVAVASQIRVEEFQEDDTYVIRAEAPGINPDDDIDLTITNAMLRLDIRRRQKKKEKERKRQRTEFVYGSFTRIITLPRKASEKNVTAQYEDGILEVRVPLNGEDADTHHVPVRRR
jgi:HSP20 family protein